MKIKINILELSVYSLDKDKIIKTLYLNFESIPYYKDDIVINDITYKLKKRTFYDNGEIRIDVFKF